MNYASFHYHINLDERGEFRADVRGNDEDTLWSTDGFDIFEDGFMRHKDDMDGLADYLVSLGIMPAGASLINEG